MKGRQTKRKKYKRGFDWFVVSVDEPREQGRTFLLGSLSRKENYSEDDSIRRLSGA